MSEVHHAMSIEPTSTEVLDALEVIQRRVLWLSTRIVDHANRERPRMDGLKVGGHQASSASMVSLMTALWFAHLSPHDRVAVKPHAAPVLHAIQYLLGNIERDDLLRLRAFGGLQAYPSITKDRFPVDFSTGSVGLGAVAPLMAAVTRRYVDAHFGARPRSRFVALVGDAELDEGNVWEAVGDPVTAGLGGVVWVVDLNRQSLDRVVPGVKAASLQRMFAENGWQVLEAKYGRRLQAVFARGDGEALRGWIDAMPNERFQASLRLRGGALRDFFFEGADPAVVRAVADVEDDELHLLVHNLGGHDLGSLLEVYRQADSDPDRPAVVFAYTIKGWGLPIAGDPLNHSALLTGEQIAELRRAVGLSEAQEWDRLAKDTSAGRLVAETAARLTRDQPGPRPAVTMPTTVWRGSSGPVSTQAAFGRLLVGLGRDPEVGRLLVSTSPDVASSTGLAGWINKAGVFAPTDRPAYGPSGPLQWREHPHGQHLPLGISEMTLFSLLGALGMADRHSDQTLVPIGTLYDPFVCRGLDALIHSVYSGARFIVAGTPSGVTLAPEGGAHQSTITPSIGLELPQLTFAEPAYVGALDWLLCDTVQRIVRGGPDSQALYLRLTTRELDQTPFQRARDRLGEERLRADVLAGGYVLAEHPAAGPRLGICASGAVVPEALEAAEELAREGVAVRVVDITSLDRLYRDWRASLVADVRTARHSRTLHHLARLLGGWTQALVTVHDAASHAMAWIGAAAGQVVVPLGVDEFGQSGTVPDLYHAHDLDPGAIVNAGLLALTRAGVN